MQITNKHDIPLPLAVWLVNDDYDYINEENYISATSLMKPIRQMVLDRRIPREKREAPDVIDLVASASGNAFHDSIEKSWINNYARNLKKLGFPEDQISRVEINPTVERPDTIPIYLEQRSVREIVVDGVTYRIGGKFDLVAAHMVHDVKSTSTYTWTKGTRDDDFILQGSIYRWIHRDKIKSNFIRILFIFTDWSKAYTNQPGYPQQRVAYKDLPLLSIEDTHKWIENRIRTIQAQQDLPEPGVIQCTDEEMWMTTPSYKYYSDPNKVGGRSTKNFDNKEEADTHCEKMGKGIVITVPGMPKRCSQYCPVFPICTQKDKYQHD